MMLAAEKQPETKFLSNNEKRIWIEDVVERETAGVRERVEVTKAEMRLDQDDTEAAETARLTFRDAEKTFHKGRVAIRDCLSDVASSEDGKDGEDDDDNHGQNVIRSRTHRQTSQSLL
jgi:hypothetical protein